MADAHQDELQRLESIDEGKVAGTTLSLPLFRRRWPP
jgi:hypothetical protein